MGFLSGSFKMSVPVGSASPSVFQPLTPAHSHPLFSRLFPVSSSPVSPFFISSPSPFHLFSLLYSSISSTLASHVHCLRFPAPLSYSPDSPTNIPNNFRTERIGTTKPLPQASDPGKDLYTSRVSFVSVSFAPRCVVTSSVLSKST